MISHTVTQGQDIRLEIQKGVRPGRVLATIGDQMLVEYEMPEGTTSLTYVEGLDAHDDQLQGRRFRNPYGYERTPVKWLRQMVENQIEWKGLSQAGPVLTAKELLAKRTTGTASPHGWIDYHTRHERTFRGKIICINVEVWGWTILIDGNILGHLRQGLATLALAKSLAVRACVIPEKTEV